MSTALYMGVTGTAGKTARTSAATLAELTMIAVERDAEQPSRRLISGRVLT
jgi:hypothetical protein